MNHFIRRPAVLLPALVIFGGLFLTASPAQAAEGFAHWWLPDDYSTHGHAIDSLFRWIFWITMVVFIVVEIVLVVFLIKYRARPDRKKAHFIHGNTRLEMCWTIAPAFILAGLSLFGIRVWNNYRYSPASEAKDLARILVIGQQFKWNVIYPGPDGKFGRYLAFPKTTDLAWPVDEKGNAVSFQGVKGPAYLPYGQAVTAINNYIEQKNKLGKVFNDPNGLDDNWVADPGRQIEIPVNRSVEVQLSSKDVIHDFFLPNFRVKLDAVPGMRGVLYFVATKTSAQREAESAKTYKLETLAELTARPNAGEYRVKIDDSIKSPALNKDKFGWRFVDSKKSTIIRNGAGIPAEPDKRQAVFDKLKTAGVSEVSVYQPGYFDLVCEELCGQGHYTMQGQLVVLDNDKFIEKYEKPRTAAAPMTPGPLAEAGK